ncbi:MAG: aldehyde ferredoxin oxidoreductase family protein [Rhodospirillales bacterium]|nr:aldehyde ferredoxin oxidoreductase family protein [Rhodospirillales bacterium]
MAWAEDYIGQRGLGTKYLMEEIDPKIDPLSPDNKLIFATGPMTGTGASTGGRWSVITKGALTGAIACSNSGGHFGGELKTAGWDMIIFEGRAPKPVYLYIQNDKVEILDADGFIWGHTVWETEDMVCNRHHDPEIKLASIGVAGEQGVKYACVVNDRDRAAGRSGVGTVMGSKNLKTVAVRGTKGVSVDDPKKFLAVSAAASAKLNATADAKRRSAVGTMAMMDVTNSWGCLPTRNCQDVQFEGAHNINVAAMLRIRKSDGKSNLKTNKGCFACTIACGRVSVIDPTHFSIRDKGDKYKGAEGGLEYEGGFALGPFCGVDDIEAATYAQALCNEHSMDPISFGATLGAAMELFEIGAITTENTGGMALNFGSAEALCWAAEVTGTQQGFGKELGLGSKLLCEKYGHPELSMSVKGQEFAGYDPRAMQGMGLLYATSNRGACHLRGAAWTEDFTDVSTIGRAPAVKTAQDGMAMYDSTGLCMFARGGIGNDGLLDQLNAGLPGTWDAERLTITGERIWNLERQFNLAAGLTSADDTLPKRMLEEPAKTGAAAGKVNMLGDMLPDYYELRGWTKDGVPTPETLSRLSLS